MLLLISIFFIYNQSSNRYRFTKESICQKTSNRPQWNGKDKVDFTPLVIEKYYLYFQRS